MNISKIHRVWRVSRQKKTGLLSCERAKSVFCYRVQPSHVRWWETRGRNTFLNVSCFTLLTSVSFAVSYITSNTLSMFFNFIAAFKWVKFIWKVTLLCLCTAVTITTNTGSSYTVNVTKNHLHSHFPDFMELKGQHLKLISQYLNRINKVCGHFAAKQILYKRAVLKRI